MSVANPADEIERQGAPSLMQSVWARIREHLETERHRINEEIRNYPTPIPACDAQFNYLLEERSRIPEELKRLEAMAAGCATPGDHIKSIDEFIESSGFIKDEVERRLRTFFSNDLGASD